MCVCVYIIFHRSFTRMMCVRYELFDARAGWLLLPLPQRMMVMMTMMTDSVSRSHENVNVFAESDREYSFFYTVYRTVGRSVVRMQSARKRNETVRKLITPPADCVYVHCKQLYWLTDEEEKKNVIQSHTDETGLLFSNCRYKHSSERIALRFIHASFSLSYSLCMFVPCISPALQQIHTWNWLYRYRSVVCAVYAAQRMNVQRISTHFKRSYSIPCWMVDWLADHFHLFLSLLLLLFSKRNCFRSWFLVKKISRTVVGAHVPGINSNK